MGLDASGCSLSLSLMHLFCISGSCRFNNQDCLLDDLYCGRGCSNNLPD